MAPCVVVERLDGKQRCSRAEVSEHAGIQARKWSSWLFTKKREVNEKNDQTLNSPHTITTARRTDNIQLICTGAGPIHPVHSQPMSLATETLPETRLHFCHFPAVLPKISWISFSRGSGPPLRNKELILHGHKVCTYLIHSTDKNIHVTISRVLWPTNWCASMCRFLFWNINKFWSRRQFFFLAFLNEFAICGFGKYFANLRGKIPQHSVRQKGLSVQTQKKAAYSAFWSWTVVGH